MSHVDVVQSCRGFAQLWEIEGWAGGQYLWSLSLKMGDMGNYQFSRMFGIKCNKYYGLKMKKRKEIL